MEATRLMVIPSTAVIYSNGSQECERAGALLKSLGGEYLEYRLNQHFTQRAFEQEFGKDATYPQIALGAQHVGHLKELLQYGKDNGLF
jgi:glutaredoxin